jgi:hypothetical protein
VTKSSRSAVSITGDALGLVLGSLGSKSNRYPFGAVQHGHQVPVQQQTEIRMSEGRLRYYEDLPNATSLDSEHLHVRVDYEVIPAHRTTELTLKELPDESEFLLVERRGYSLATVDDLGSLLSFEQPGPSGPRSQVRASAVPRVRFAVTTGACTTRMWRRTLEVESYLTCLPRTRRTGGARGRRRRGRSAGSRPRAYRKAPACAIATG